MKPIIIALVALAFAVGCAGDDELDAARAAAAAKDPAVVLPEFDVVASRPWLYVKVPGGQILSQASRADTMAVAKRILVEQAFLNELVPEIRCPESYTAFTLVLDATGIFSRISRASTVRSARDFYYLKSGRDSQIYISARLGREADASERTAGGFCAIYFDDLLARHNELPEWYRCGGRPVFGITMLPSNSHLQTSRNYRARYQLYLELLQIVGLEKNEGDAAPEFWPFERFFAATLPDPSVSSLVGLSLKARIHRDQCRLFVDWGLCGGGEKQREAFRRFVSEACRRPVDEALFRSCFGFGYEEGQRLFFEFAKGKVRKAKKLRWALAIDGIADGSDMGFLLTERLKKALKAKVEVRPATRAEVTMMVGEAYLAVAGAALEDKSPVAYSFPFSGGRSPERYARSARFFNQYREHVRENRTESKRKLFERVKSSLERSRLDNGASRNPELAALAGMLELQMGHDAEAVRFLQEAVGGRINRPGVYYELAQLRMFEAMQSPKGGDGRLSREQVESVRGLLIEALKMNPQMESAHRLLASVWGYSGEVPPAEDLALLAKSARWYSRYGWTTAEAAMLFERAGNREEAAALARVVLAWSEGRKNRDRAEREQMRRLAGQAGATP